MLPGGPIASILILALFAVTLIVLAIAFYKLFEKAGFSGALGLLMLVPVVNLGVALYLAFAEWPVMAELARQKLIAASALGQGAAGECRAFLLATVGSIALRYDEERHGDADEGDPLPAGVDVQRFEKSRDCRAGGPRQHEQAAGDRLAEREQDSDARPMPRTPRSRRTFLCGSLPRQA